MLEASEANPQPAADLSNLTDEEVNQFLAASLAADAGRVERTVGEGG
jgi:hypothetical protein